MKNALLNMVYLIAIIAFVLAIGYVITPLLRWIARNILHF